jgi:hypothetical protein
MRFAGLASIALIAAVAGGSLWYLRHASGSHPLAADARPAVCGALGLGPSGGIEARMPGSASPLGEMPGDDRLHRVAEDHGVLLRFAGRVPEAMLREAARRSAEALRAAMG